DLKEERRRVIQALMEMDCIPAGMELFPAADEEQWAFIKHIINDCDYYILIIGGRYGSTTAEGISYTEKEYDYAIDIGLKVLAFIHEKPDDIPVGKSDIDPELRARLATFREKVSKGRLVKMWSVAAELPGLVALSLSKTIKTYPAIGWVRANQVANADLLGELNELRKQNQELEKIAISAIKTPKPAIENLAKLNDSVTLSGTTWKGRYGSSSWNHTLTWSDIFALIAPYLLEHPNDHSVKEKLIDSIKRIMKISPDTMTLDDQEFQTIKIQLMAHGLVNVEYSKTVQGGMALFWSLTELGQSMLVDLRTIKSKI
ncbi:MAG: DUF4062 domain-containing protein, partial [Bacteroidota bacterium]